MSKSESIVLKNIGAIKEATIELGDFTVLVGPQGTGKTTFLHILALVTNYRYIIRSLKDRGFDWGKSIPDFWDTYLGIGMKSIWKNKSSIRFGKKGAEEIFRIEKFITGEGTKINRDSSKTFFVPALRFSIIENGWPKLFTDFGLNYPFQVKEFTTQVKDILEKITNKNEEVFSTEVNRLKKDIRKSINKSIYNGAKIKLKKVDLRNQLVLDVDKDESLPTTVWSTGQREFTPFLLSLIFLSDNNTDYKYVIIEEIEMGLHPKAIITALITVLDLLQKENQFKIILSTHSPIVLEIIYAIREMKKAETKSGRNAFYQLFSLRPNDVNNQNLAKTVLEKNFEAYYFKPDDNGRNTEVKRISELDLLDEDNSDMSGWGGITQHSFDITKIISELKYKDDSK